MNNPIAQLLVLATAVWRRRVIAILVAWFVCLAGWWLVIQQPDVYESSARVYVDTEHILRPLLRGLTVENNVQSEVLLIQRTLIARPNLEKVARMTDLDITADTPGEMEKLIDGIGARTRVSNVGQNLFSIAYQHETPEKARDVTQAFLTLFVENNLGKSRRDMETARRFIEEQISSYERQLEEAENRLALFKQQNVELLSGQRGFSEKLGAAQRTVRSLQGSLRNAELRYATLQRELSSTPRFFPVPNSATGAGGGGGGGFGPGPSDIEVRILEAEHTVEALLSRFTEKHPDVVVARRRLDSLYEERDAEREAALQWADENPVPDTPVGNDTVGIPNPIYENLKIQLVQEEAAIAGLREDLIDARRDVEELDRLRTRVPEVEAELTRLNRDYNVIRQRYEQFLQRRESERVSRAREVEGEQIQFRIIEPPQVPASPAGPRRALFLIGVLIVGLGSGLALAVLLAYSSDRISSSLQLKETFKFPVVGTVSSFRTRGQRAWRGLKTAAFATAVVGLISVYGVLNYVERDVGLNQSALLDLLNRYAPIELLDKVPNV